MNDLPYNVNGVGYATFDEALEALRAIRTATKAPAVQEQLAIIQNKVNDPAAARRAAGVEA